MVRAAPSRSIPTLPGLPVLGGLLDFRRNEIQLYERMYARYGDISRVQLTSVSLVMLFSPSYVAQLADQDYTCLEKAPAIQHFLAPVLGRGLLSAPTAAHRQQRMRLAPLFQHRHLDRYTATMATTAERIMADWRPDQPIDLHAEMLRITLGVVGTTLFGVDVLDEADELQAALTTVQRCTNARMNAIIPLPLSWPTAVNRRFKQAIARLNTTVYRMIAQRRQHPEDRGDVMSLLLAAQAGPAETALTDTEVRDEVMTLFLAGYETTANALAWAWHLLMQHPAIYQRVQQEVQQVLRGRTPTAADLPAMPLVLQVIKEALRLYPAVPVIGRRVTVPLTIDGYDLPVNTIVGVSMYVIHRRADLFPDPARFDPDRWLPEREAALPRYSYLPFGIGPRTCIGNQFALHEAQLVLATLAQQVTFRPVPGFPVVPESLITLRPRHGLAVTVQPRPAAPAL